MSYGIYSRCTMQTEKSKPKSKQIMPETDFIARYRHYLVTQQLGFPGLHRRPIIDIKVFLSIIGKSYFVK